MNNLNFKNNMNNFHLKEIRVDVSNIRQWQKSLTKGNGAKIVRC